MKSPVDFVIGIIIGVLAIFLSGLFTTPTPKS